jgi:Calcineurin-like phosphoesterase
MSEARINANVPDGKVVVFSDAHFWPGVESTAYNALVALLPELDTRMVVANGDILDGARISKHARIGWQHAPKLADELEVCKQRLADIRRSSPHSRFVWPLGNHDARFETFLANRSPEFEGVPGFSLKEHFPSWEPCWSLHLNGNTVIKHRWLGGKNATLNNTIQSGTSIVTGHLHSARVSPYTDFTGTRYGVDAGCLADIGGPQFTAYLEDGCRDWRSGFAVLTFKNGELLWPEHVIVVGENKVAWRGQVLTV